MSSLLTDIPNELQGAILTKMVQHSIHFVYLHPVNFVLQWLPMEDIDSYIISNEINGLNLKKQITNWETPVVADFGLNILSHWRLNATTKQTGDPYRPSIARFKLPKEEFEWSTERKGGLNLQDITEAAYRLKGSKYDYENEHLDKIEVMDENTQNIHLRFHFSYQKSRAKKRY